LKVIITSHIITYIQFLLRWFYSLDKSFIRPTVFFYRIFLFILIPIYIYISPWYQVTKTIEIPLYHVQKDLPRGQTNRPLQPVRMASGLYRVQMTCWHRRWAWSWLEI